MELGSHEWKTLILDAAAQIDISLQEFVADQFAVYAAELAIWNRTTNLTSITSPEDIALKHFVDSIAALPMLPTLGSLLDVGTGGGFPGLPLKIAIPEMAVTLVDASRKKVSFLKHVIRTLGLTGIDALQMRIQDMPDTKGFKARYDIVVSRAYTSLTKFVMQASPLLAPGGFLIAFKGPEVDEEITALAKTVNNQGTASAGSINLDDLGLEIVHYQLPFLNAQRSLVRLKPTPHLEKTLRLNL